MIKQRPVISVDYDGTITKKSAYPNVGELADLCYEVMNMLHDLGVDIIVNTCRVDRYLEEALQYLNKKEIPYDVVNDNILRFIIEYGNNPRKINAHYMIDDRNLGGFPGWKIVWNIIIQDGWFSEEEDYVRKVMKKYLKKESFDENCMIR